MTAPVRNDLPDVSRRDEIAISGTVLSQAPWALAGAAGGVTAGGDALLHLAFGHLAVGGPLSLAAVAFFAVAAGGALIRARRSRAVRWARRHPWRFAVAPAAACAIVVFVLSVVLGGGMFGSVFTAAWHGAAVYGLTGLAGSATRSRRRA